MPQPRRRSRMTKAAVAFALLAIGVLAPAAAAAPARHAASAATAQPGGLDVSLSVQDNVWWLNFLPVDRAAVSQVRYRLAAAADPAAPASAANAANTAWQLADECLCVKLGALTAGRHRLEIEVTGKPAGAAAGAAAARTAAYTWSFDPDEEIVRLAKDYLALGYHWLAFDDRPRYSWSLGFISPVEARDAIQEVRWSLDDCALDRRFPLGPPSPPGNYALPRAIDHDQKLSERVPVSAQTACVQLVFRDGSTSETRRIRRDRPFPPPAEAAATLSLPPAVSSTSMAAPVPARAGHPAQPAQPAQSALQTVALKPMRSNAGWWLTFETPARRDLSEIRYRLDGDAEWRTTGLSAEVNLDRQARLPRRTVAVDPYWVTPGRHRIEVEMTDWHGTVSPSQDLWFDPEAEVLAAAKRRAVDPHGHWVSLRDYGGRRLVYFDLSFKDALREIRYSVDGCALDRRFPFDAWTDLSQPPRYTEKSDLALPEGASSVCVQLVFRDGEVSAPRRFGIGGEETK